MDFHLNKAKAKQATDVLKKRFLNPNDLEREMKQQMALVEDLVARKMTSVMDRTDSF